MATGTALRSHFDGGYTNIYVLKFIEFYIRRVGVVNFPHNFILKNKHLLYARHYAE